VLTPGVLVCGVIALASTFLSEYCGGPKLLYALLIGLAFHFIHGNPQAKPGIEFCGRTVLRVGVALLGVRITLNQVSQLGFEVARVILLALVLTILMGVWWAKLLGRARARRAFSRAARPQSAVHQRHRPFLLCCRRPRPTSASLFLRWWR
jgi:uncharacterized membrane protein YadS